MPSVTSGPEYYPLQVVLDIVEISPDDLSREGFITPAALDELSPGFPELKPALTGFLVAPEVGVGRTRSEDGLNRPSSPGTTRPRNRGHREG